MDGALRSELERDDSGFVSLLALRAVARRLTAIEFVAAYPHPALLVPIPEAGARRSAQPSSDSTRLEISYMRTMISSASDTPRPGAIAIDHGYGDRVALLAKRPGNPFPKVISVGRAMSNDVVFLLETVSKLQGYFTQENGTWRFTDQGSSNGTLVRTSPIDAGKACALADGDRIRFGLEVEVLFFTPAKLHEQLVAPVVR